MKYPVAKPVFNGNERKYLIEAFDSSWISSTGKFIDSLETEFAKYCGTNYALTCSNGTTALHLALLALDIGPGDEVIVPTFTYVATANAVRYCGATPVFVDCREDTWNIDETLIEKAITEKTKAIMLVHLYGHPCEMEPIWKIAKKYNFKIIEDAAEAHGATYYCTRHSANSVEYKMSPPRNDYRSLAKKVGSLADIGTFSLFGNKIITSGEGGIVTTNDGKLAERIKLLKDQGMSRERRYWFPIVGYNYRMTNLQAAIALGQLECIDWHLERRQEIANRYNANLNGSKTIKIPLEKNNVKHAYWMYSVIFTEHCSLPRDEIMARLAKVGIDSRPFFYPVHTLPPYFEERFNNKYPVADRISKKGINLPTSSDLTKSSIDEISEALLGITGQ